MTQQSIAVTRSKSDQELSRDETSKPSEEIAAQLVNDCLRIGSEDVVVIDTVPHMISLASQISIACYKNGADSTLSLHSDEVFLGLLGSQTPDQLSRPSKISLSLAETMTANISLVTLENPEPLRRVPPENMAAIERSRKPVDEIMLKRRVKTAYVGLSDITARRAETYGLDLARWRRAVETASIEDYTKMASFGRKITEMLRDGSEVHIKSPGGTDLNLKIASRYPRLNDGIIDEEDMRTGAYSIVIPAGDIAVRVAEDSAEGRFVSDVPQPWLGRMVEGVEWHFKHGKITEFNARNNLSSVKSHYEASQGQKDRVGALSLGLNTKAACGQLFNLNRIASGAITVGIGGNKKLGGENESEFDFQTTISDGTLTIDGGGIIKNGRYLV